MRKDPEGNAIVYCEGAFLTTTGKTAHGLVRKTRRYQVLAVVDSTAKGRDSGEVLDRKPNGIPIVGSLAEAVAWGKEKGTPASHFVIGLAPDGGRLRDFDRRAVAQALKSGLHVDSGLHDFLTEDAEFVPLAQQYGVVLRDVRKTPPRGQLHGFTGRIEQVSALRVAVLGTDSAVGKRTTAWLLCEGLSQAGYTSEMIGTGQTAWLQGARYSICLDSLINDFVAGELEHAVLMAWDEQRPEVIIVEGQGSLLNPAYPGGLEILAATRPHAIVLQHAPARQEYDGFPGFPIHDVEFQKRALEMLSSKPVVCVTINHEGLAPESIPKVCAELQGRLGIPVVDVLAEGAGRLVEAVTPLILRMKNCR